MLQASLLARKAHKDLGSRLSALQSVHGLCAQKLRNAQESAAANLKAGREVQQELEEFVKKVKVMEVEMTGKAQEAITQQAMRTRVEVMQEYYRGEHTGWDLDETIRIYNEAYPEDAFLSQTVQTGIARDELVVEEASPSGDAEVKDAALASEKTDVPVDDDGVNKDD